MGWTDDLRKLKEDSLDSAHLRHGKQLFSDLRAMSDRLLDSIDEQLSEPERIREDDVNNDEEVRTEQALKRIKFQDDLRRIFKKYADSIMLVRNSYYVESKDRISKSWNRSTPSFYTLTPKFPKSDMTEIVRQVNNRDIKDVLRNLEQRTTWTLQTTIIDAYKPVPQIRDRYLIDFRKKLRGNMNSLNRSFENMTQDLFVSVFEQAVNGTINFINGKAG